MCFWVGVISEHSVDKTLFIIIEVLSKDWNTTQKLILYKLMVN